MKSHTVGMYRLAIYSPVRFVATGVSFDCLHHHHNCWRVHLLGPNELPQIASVRSLEARNRGYEYYEWNHHDF